MDELKTCQSKSFNKIDFTDDEKLKETINYLNLNDIRMVTVENSFNNVEEALNFAINYFQSFPKSLLILNFPNVTNDKHSKRFKIENSYWGPQIFIISSKLCYYKQPNRIKFKLLDLNFGKLSEQQEDDLIDILRKKKDFRLLFQGIVSDLFGSIENNFRKITLVEKYLTRRVPIYFEGDPISKPDLLFVRFLKIFNENRTVESLQEYLNHSVTHNNMKYFLEIIGLSKFTAFDEIKDKRIVELLKIDKRLLLSAVWHENIEVVKFLLHHQLNDVNYRLKYEKDFNKTVLRRAFADNNHKIVINLLKHDAKMKDLNLHLGFYEKSEVLKMPRVKNLLDDIETIHDVLQNSDEILASSDNLAESEGKTKIEEIILKYPTMKHFYNLKGDSAPATALKNKKFKFYEFVISKGIILGPDEDIQNYLSFNKNKVRDIHRKVLKLPYEDHLINLMKHCHVGHDVKEEQKPFHNELILRALNKLSSLKEVRCLLELVSVFDTLRFVFEFNRSTVDQIDPTSGKYTLGKTYLNGWIYIGAKGLKNSDENSEEYREALGTTAHEVCHLAMQLTFDNFAKPFTVNDSSMFQKFSTIVREYKEIVESKETVDKIEENNNDNQEKLRENRIKNEKIISRVFDCYEESLWDAELIVRVPELCAFYMNDSKMLKNLRKTFENLFNFYDIISDKILNKVFRIKITNAVNFTNEVIGLKREIKKLTERIKMKETTLNIIDNNILISNCPMLTMKLINETLDDETFIYSKFESLTINKILELICESQNFEIKPTLIVYCNESFDEKNLKENFEKVHEKVRKKVNLKIVFIFHDELQKNLEDFFSENFTLNSIKHEWKDFNFEHYGLNFKILFQGKETYFHNVFRLHGEDRIQKVKFLPLNILFSKNLIKVGKSLEFNEGFYYERTFSNGYDMNIKIEDTYRKIILLTDEPGMGKSMTMRKIASEMWIKNINDHKYHWTFYIDLKLYFSTYEKFKDVKDFSLEKVVNIFTHMMNFSDIENEIFYHKLKNYEITFLFDGVDEIAPNYKEFIIGLIKKIWYLKRDTETFGSNKIWIASRPHCVQDLRKTLRNSSYTLSPINQEDFLLKYFEHHKTSEEEKNNILKFVDYMKVEWSEEYKNPFLIIISLDIYKELDGDDNFYTFYEKFLFKKLNIIVQGEGKGMLRKNDSVNVMTREINLIEFHQKFAIKNLLKNKEIYSDPFGLSVMEANHDDIKEDNIFGFGILYGNSYDDCYFSHQTFLEFFIAKYIIEKVLKNLDGDNNENWTRVEFFFCVIANEDFKQIQKFIEYYLKKNEIKITGKFSKLLKQKVKKFCDKEFPVKIQTEKFSLFASHFIFTHLISYNFTHLFSFIQRCLKCEEKIIYLSQNILETRWESMKIILDLYDVRKILKKYFFSDKIIYYCDYNKITPKIPSFERAFEKFSPSELKHFLSLIDETFNTLEIEELFFNKKNHNYHYPEIVFDYLDLKFNLRINSIKSTILRLKIGNLRDAVKYVCYLSLRIDYEKAKNCEEIKSSLISYLKNDRSSILYTFSLIREKVKNLNENEFKIFHKIKAKSLKDFLCTEEIYRIILDELFDKEKYYSIGFIEPIYLLTIFAPEEIPKFLKTFHDYFKRVSDEIVNQKFALIVGYGLLPDNIGSELFFAFTDRMNAFDSRSFDILMRWKLIDVFKSEDSLKKKFQNFLISKKAIYDFAIGCDEEYKKFSCVYNGKNDARFMDVDDYKNKDLFDEENYPILYLIFIDFYYNFNVLDGLFDEEFLDTKMNCKVYKKSENETLLEGLIYAGFWIYNKNFHFFKSLLNLLKTSPSIFDKVLVTFKKMIKFKWIKEEFFVCYFRNYFSDIFNSFLLKCFYVLVAKSFVIVGRFKNENFLFSLFTSLELFDQEIKLPPESADLCAIFNRKSSIPPKEIAIKLDLYERRKIKILICDLVALLGENDPGIDKIKNIYKEILTNQMPDIKNKIIEFLNKHNFVPESENKIKIIKFLE